MTTTTHLPGGRIITTVSQPKTDAHVLVKATEISSAVGPDSIAAKAAKAKLQSELNAKTEAAD
jgi:hypothetical protein